MPEEPVLVYDLRDAVMFEQELIAGARDAAMLFAMTRNATHTKIFNDARDAWISMSQINDAIGKPRTPKPVPPRKLIVVEENKVVSVQMADELVGDPNFDVPKPTEPPAGISVLGAHISSKFWRAGEGDTVPAGKVSIFDGKRYLKGGTAPWHYYTLLEEVPKA